MEAVRYAEVLSALRNAYDAQVAAREQMPFASWKEPLRARFLERLRAITVDFLELPAHVPEPMDAAFAMNCFAARATC
jgi:hypothetical protein